MKKKNLISLLLVGVLSIGLIGCSNSGQASTNDNKSKDLLAEIKDRGTLKIGTEGAYAPYTYHNDKNELVGYDVEIGQAIAKELGVKAEFVETPWDSCIAGLDSERYDVVMNQVGITDERKQKYDFSTPYTVTRAVLIVEKNNQDIKSFEDLKGKKTAQGLTSNFADMSKGYGAELVDTDGTFSKSIDLINNGRADATVNDDVTFYDYLKQKPDAPLKITDTLDKASENAVLMRKGNDSFVKAVNDALAKLNEDGTLQKISEKYFGTNVTK
ncbi:amino acid ABC transporter substrate-binding protein [Clostridium uliginosum]|uniref:Cystine transport system substrate-binding protein n=1 Tax=Clostridium uliginosum TaxID=119641 RepID=A0A1I1NJR2_9CLOT|nr:amino acid ABC transporter substrate-binding protein [Clostridium uliginosum]SFC97666.1 cystine transport system substrate-binding protein [Clostridium uliginosum]